MINIFGKLKNYGLLEIIVFSSLVYVISMLLWTVSTRSAVEERANIVKSNHKSIVDFINNEINYCESSDDKSKTKWGDLCKKEWSSFHLAVLH